MTRQIKQSLTLKKLLERFPQGIVVSPSGKVFEITYQTKNPQDLPMRPPTGGGYLVVANPVLQEGDDRLFVKPKHT